MGSKKKAKVTKKTSKKKVAKKKVTAKKKPARFKEPRELLKFEAGEDLKQGDAVKIEDGKVFKIAGEVVDGQKVGEDNTPAIMEDTGGDAGEIEIEDDDTRDFKESDVVDADYEDDQTDYPEFEDEK